VGVWVEQVDRVKESLRSVDGCASKLPQWQNHLVHCVPIHVAVLECRVRRNTVVNGDNS
jgi:hypothetical protein